ncbi:MAG TPA: NAD-dependent malic enzyme [Anaeromyxobacteraceae bacterium]|nr:NAD-dependent malic enzyme [Anaeromyxobacteraceae bacterium]
MDDTATTPTASLPRGEELLHDPLLNKGTAFTRAERRALGLEGLLPPHVHTLEEQVARVMDNYRMKTTDLERYIHLTSLQDRNETLFYRVVVDHVEEMMPIIYTPTVGKACQQWGHLFRRPRGVYVSWGDRGRVESLLRNWPHRNVRVIVVTDGERILGLGDQGVGGMGIPVGKLSLYTACAGIDPAATLPVMLDVGTENEGYLRDPLYMGTRQRRVRGAEYDAFVAEFVEAVRAVFPRALLQFEDFGNLNAFRLLEHWRERVPCFNDDIQGTAAVTLAGLCSALRLTGGRLRDQTVLFLGAGEAGIGIGDLVASAMVDEGATLDEARRRLWFVDSQGLVVRGRSGLAAHKLRFAHDAPGAPDLISAIRTLRPTALVGVSTAPKSFDRAVVETMAALNPRPIVFALSNPTSRSECSAEEAYRWSEGRAIFASGSPFPPVQIDGRTFVPGQGNNAYIFPGVGLGVVACQARRVTDRMFSAAARTLASLVLPSDLALGRVYPALDRIREVSADIGAAVAEVAFEDGVAGVERPADVLALVRSAMWHPTYPTYA